MQSTSPTLGNVTMTSDGIFFLSNIVTVVSFIYKLLEASCILVWQIKRSLSDVHLEAKWS